MLANAGQPMKKLAHRNCNGASVVRVKANADRRAEKLRPVLSELRTAGITGLILIAAELNRRQVPTPRQGQVAPHYRLLRRLRSIEQESTDERPIKLAA